ncbi:MAG: zinc-ribbon domain-containing protein [Amaricoccus sp.]
MLLNCPNCHAEYDVPDGMIPAAGRHVQCSACHTRWFVAGAPRVLLTEEQILHRLESWTPRPRPLAAAPKPAPEVVDPPDEEAGPAEPPLPPPTPIRRVAPAKPGERPTVDRPAVVAPVDTAGVPASVAPLRPALRLDLDSAPVAAPPAPRSRFGAGLLLAVLLAALAFAAYQQRSMLAAGVPAAAPALEAYGDAVDDARTAVEAQLAPLRKAIEGP